MLLAAGAAFLGGIAGWGVATGQPGSLVAIPAALILGVLVARSRLERPTQSTPVIPEAAWSELHVELARSRRHHRSMAILRIPAGTGGPEVVERLTQRLRRFDRAWSAHGDIIVLLPETDGPAADRLATRLSELSGSAKRVGVAVFPDDGLTSGTLMASLYGPPATRASTHDAGAPIGELPSNVIELRPNLGPDHVTVGRESIR